jgi:hypothetical protein
VSSPSPRMVRPTIVIDAIAWIVCRCRGSVMVPVVGGGHAGCMKPTKRTQPFRRRLGRMTEGRRWRRCCVAGRSSCRIRRRCGGGHSGLGTALAKTVPPGNRDDRTGGNDEDDEHDRQTEESDPDQILVEGTVTSTIEGGARARPVPVDGEEHENDEPGCDQKRSHASWRLAEAPGGDGRARA